MYQKIFQNYKWYFLLLVTIILGYWQLSFMIKIMKWDMTMYYFPMRYYIGECLQNGFLPLWNSHQFLGSPIHSDPQSSVFYPITWIIGYFFGYNFYTLHIDFLLHIFIGGCGILKFGKYLNLDAKSSFIMAISYVFSGVIIGNAQHFSWIISAAWIPYILMMTHQLFNRSHNSFNSITFGFLLFLLITGGYSGFLIILFHILTGYTVHKFFLLIKQKNYVLILSKIKLLSIMCFSFMIFSFGYIMSIIQVLPHFSRANSISLDKVLQNSTSVKSLISLVFPYATTTQFDFWDVGVSMSNSYFGMISFLLIIFSLFINKNKKSKQLIFIGLLCLFIALGNELPFRKFLYDFIPGMNLFRHPAIFRYFTLLFWILAMGYTSNLIFQNFKKYKKLLLALSLILFSLISLFIIYLLPETSNHLITKYLISWIKMEPYTNNLLLENIVIQGYIQIIVLIGFISLLLLYDRIKFKYISTGIIIIFCFDLIVATQLNLPVTAISKRNFKAAQIGFNTLPHGFKKEYFYNNPINAQKEEKSNELNIYGIYSNLNIFDKQVGFNGYNPFQLSAFESIKDSAFFKEIIKNKLFYISNEFGSENLGAFQHRDSSYLYLNDKKIEFLNQEKITKSKENEIKIIEIFPNKFKVETKTDQRQLLTLLQNNYKGWKVKINGEYTTHMVSNNTFITVIIPKGKNAIDFQYEPKLIIFGFILSIGSTILFLTLFIYLKIKSKLIIYKNLNILKN